MGGQVTEGAEKVNSARETDTGRYPRPALAHERAEWVARTLAARARQDNPPAEAVRLAFAVALTRRTGARHGELAAALADDLSRLPGTLRVRRFPQGRQYRNPMAAVHVLEEEELDLARRWMAVRWSLVSKLAGGHVPSLFVTVHQTHSRGQVLPPGVPIHPDGLQLSYKRWARRTNLAQAGSYGWEPLPTRYEPLRRAWWAAP